jgi:hypothetical protein
LNVSYFLPENFKFTVYGDLFLQYSSENNDILIFYNDKYIEYIKNSKYCICDGSFKSPPKEFLQLYTFNCEILGCIFPMIYIFLKSKTKLLYYKAFKFLYDKNILNSNIKYILDFEYANVSAIKKLNKEADINYCFFHYSQTIWRRIQSSSLVILYKTNIQF